MTSGAGAPPRVLLVGGGGGLVGRAVLRELAPSFRIRSVHRSPVPAEAAAGVEWVPGDVAFVRDFDPLLEGVDAIVNLAWYRWESPQRFRALYEGLSRLLEASARHGSVRIVHVSVPAAPTNLETGLPYLTYKRRLDRELAASGLSYRILRPTLLFGPGDRLLTVMLRLMATYHLFPMFGDGRYHVSPLATADLARVVRQEIEGTGNGTVDLGGPERWVYRDLTDRMFSALRRTPRYVGMGERTALFVARLVVGAGSKLIYPYEVEWLMSDLLGLPAYRGLATPLEEVGPFLDRIANQQAQV